MSDHLERLERLAKLRADGALTEQEYAAQKAALLSAGAPRVEAQIVGHDPRPSRTWLWLGVAILVGVVILAAGYSLVMKRSPTRAPPAASSPAISDATALSKAVAEPADLTKEEAFRIVYPTGKAVAKFDDESINVRFSPITLVRLDASTQILISGGQNLDQDCHGCTGFFSVAYLGAAPGWTVEGVPYVGMGQTGGFGTPPEIAIIRSLGPEPMVFVRSGQSGQGSTESWGQLVRLGATIDDVSIALTRFDVSYDNDGGAADCSIEGRIVPGKPGRSFTIRYTGAYSGDVVYTSSGGAYTPVGGPPRDLWKRCPGMEDEE